jgi:hypothetical protein
MGTAADPIVFTSAAETPAAGDWLGVYFASTPHPTSRLDHVRVEYAGGTSSFGTESCYYDPMLQNDAAIRITTGDPPSQLVTHSTIADSASHGIDRGWRGGPVDFLATNELLRVARCRQTFPTPVGSPCPWPPPCD